MSSETKNISGLVDAAIGTQTWQTTITNSDGSKVVGTGVSPQTSQQNASNKNK